jgi:hypothetical protein
VPERWTKPSIGKSQYGLIQAAMAEKVPSAGTGLLNFAVAYFENENSQTKPFA